MSSRTWAAAVSCIALMGPFAVAGPRDVQIRSVDLTASVLELHNFGATDEPLDGYRFCSHDEAENRRYSSSSGLDGVTLAAGASLWIHFEDDAPPGEPDRLDRSDLGGSFALPLDTGPYAIQLYFPPVQFGSGDSIGDHLQWSIDGVDDTRADERSDEAEDGGVWLDQSAWIETTATTASLRLVPGGQLRVAHGPDDYDVFDATGAGALPDDGLRVDTTLTGALLLEWEPSCREGDVDYVVYVGPLGDADGAAPELCSTGGATSVEIDPLAEAVFFYVAPSDGEVEGAAGRLGDGTQRPQPGTTCQPRRLAACP